MVTERRSAVTGGEDAAIGSRRRIIAEVLLVLGVSLGISALASLLAFVDAATRPEPLGAQTTQIVAPASPRPWLDLLYQLLGIVNAIVPAGLVLYLLWRPGVAPWRRLGLDRPARFARPRPDTGAASAGGTGKHATRGAAAATGSTPSTDSTEPVGGRLGITLRDAGLGIGLVALIGVPGLALYFAGRGLGITLNVVPTALDAHWWTIPVLVLVALRAAVIEELVGIGYLYTRLAELGWSRWLIIASTALFRGSYHLYQGVGAFLGNAAMGLVFGWVYLRTGRLWPLLLAHLIIDLLVFLGYPLVAAGWPGLFGVADR